MSTFGRLLRLAPHQGFKTVRSVSTRARSIPLASTVNCLCTSRIHTKNEIYHTRRYLFANRRFYSSEGFLKNQGEMRIAIIGQSMFGQEVYKLLCTQGHNVVAVFTIPDIQGRADPLAEIAQKDGVPVFKFPRWRSKGKPIPSVLEKYKSTDADLNVLPFCTQFIPMDVINHPKHGSIIYHPSILPLHRGASAINWTLMEGDEKAGFSIFWADDGLDTGPILLQKETKVDINDTVDTLYTRFLYPEGIRAMGKAVRLIEEGKAPRVPQWEGGATYDQIWNKKEVAKISWDKPALAIHNFIRGNDKLPGAWSKIDGKEVTFYGSQFIDNRVPVMGTEVQVEGLSQPAVVNNDGMYIFGTDGKKVRRKKSKRADKLCSMWSTVDSVVSLCLSITCIVYKNIYKIIDR